MADWHCHVCGTRLSYGVYCKTCQTETDFSWRPAADAEIEAAEMGAVVARYQAERERRLQEAYDVLGWGYDG